MSDEDESVAQPAESVQVVGPVRHRDGQTSSPHQVFELYMRRIPESKGSRKVREGTIGTLDVGQRREDDDQPIGRPTTHQTAPSDDVAAVQLSFPVDLESEVAPREPARTGDIEHDPTGAREPPTGTREHPERVVWSAEVRDNARRDDQREPIRTADVADISRDELEASRVSGG